jgi:RimJ/RimL family protein N-acetyltransferase
MRPARDEFTIRRIDEVDVDALRELRLEALRNHPVAFLSDYEAALGLTAGQWKQRVLDGAVFMAWAGETPAGMAGFYGGRSRKTSHQGTIAGVYVRAAYRGQGLAGELVNRCLEWARENGIRMVYLAAADSNTAAIRCYTRCGFRVYGVQPMAILHDGVYHNQLLMAQAL